MASMRKKIDVRQLRQGMFVDGWCGAWMDHPFWRAHFLLDDAATLAEVHASGVAQCWIDTAKGLDVQAPALRVEAAPAPAPAALPHPGRGERFRGKSFDRSEEHTSELQSH